MTSFAISIPQTVEGGRFDGAAVQTFLGRAEELGFDGAWTQESVIGDMPTLGPLETLAYAAACTDRVRLGCAVLISSLHSPLHLAKSIATLDQLSAGRLEVGLATGGGFRMFGAFGVDRSSFVARFNEGLALMRRLWNEDRVDHDGRFWQLTGVAMEPKPVQRPAPPIWFGGGAPQALRRAVAHADGFFGAGSQTTAAFIEQVRTVRAALEEAGRDPATFRIAKRVYLTVDDDAERARRRMGEELHRQYGYFGVPDLTPVSVTGPPAAVVEGLREVVDAGAELILLNPMFDDAEQLERLAAEVVPQLA
jgi:probable F420-dependent oxidoreductase